MIVDLGVKPSDRQELDDLVRFSKDLGFSALGVSGVVAEAVNRLENDFLLLRRIDLAGSRLSALKKRVAQERRRAALIAFQLTKNMDLANWAAEEARVDLIMVNHTRSDQLRDTTASLAAESGTALEIQIAPLLHTVGLERSRILKTYRECVRSALDAKMSVVLTSGARFPHGLRSPVSLRHIANLLGVRYEDTRASIIDDPRSLVERNLAKLQPSFVAEGIKILEGDEE
jgi:RNase P/RNase MRP subunit p30